MKKDERFSKGLEEFIKKPIHPEKEYEVNLVL